MSGRHCFPALGVRPGVFLRSSIARTVQGWRVGTVRTGGRAGEGRGEAGGDSPARRPGPTRQWQDIRRFFNGLWTMCGHYSTLIRHPPGTDFKVGGRAPGVARLRGTRSLGFGRGPPAGEAAPSRGARLPDPAVFDPPGPIALRTPLPPAGSRYSSMRPDEGSPQPASSLRFRPLARFLTFRLAYGSGECRKAVRGFGSGRGPGRGISPFAGREPGGGWRAASGSDGGGQEVRRRPSVRSGSRSGGRARSRRFSVPAPRGRLLTSDRRNAPDPLSTGRWPRSPVRRTSRCHAART